MKIPDAVAMGRKGGKVRSEAKAEASRRNLAKANAARIASGKLGGRPRKTEGKTRGESK